MGYPTGVSSFTSKNSGDVIQPAHVNDLQTEVAAIEGGLLNGVAHAIKPSADNGQTCGASGKNWSIGYFTALTLRGIAYVLPSADGTAGQHLQTDAAGTLSWGRGESVVALTDGSTPALDASLGTMFVLTAGGDRTIAVPSNATSGQKIVIRHLASGGARTLALNSGAGGFRFGSDITALTQTASGKIDYIGCIYNATDSKWDVVAYIKGF